MPYSESQPHEHDLEKIFICMTSSSSLALLHYGWWHRGSIASRDDEKSDSFPVRMHICTESAMNFPAGYNKIFFLKNLNMSEHFTLRVTKPIRPSDGCKMQS